MLRPDMARYAVVASCKVVPNCKVAGMPLVTDLKLRNDGKLVGEFYNQFTKINVITRDTLNVSIATNKHGAPVA